MNSNLRKFRNVFTSLVMVSLLAGAFALALPSGSVAAQGTEPPAPAIEEAQAKQTERLEKAYKAEQRLLEVQAKRIVGTAERIKNLEERIAKLKNSGKDTTALEAALQNFQNAVGEAQKTHDEAAAILKTHAGFDTEGMVTDIKAARETVSTAEKLLKAAHQHLRQALRDLLKGIRAQIRDNRKK